MKKFLVVGASNGIGKAITAELISKGNQVIGTYNTSKPNSGEQVSYHRLDVLDTFSELDFLPETLDGLVYCPGAIDLQPFKRIKPESFVQDYELQVLGAIKVIQAAEKALKKSGAASIVLFSSVAVQQGFNFHALVGSSKGALEGLTRSLAAEFAPKIRVNAIAPSLTDTPLAEKMLNNEAKQKANAERHPLKRIGKPEDIAQAACFLLDAKNSWVSGQVLAVDGGMSRLKV